MDIFESKSRQEILLTRLTTAFLILGVILCIYTPNYLIFNWWAKYAPQIAIAYWVLGLIFLALKSPRLTLVSFICCAFLCLNLKNTTGSAISSVKVTSEPIVRIAQFNLSASNSEQYETIRTIKNTKADVLSLQEVTLEWYPSLKDSLSDSYPYNCSYYDSDVNSLRLYSKYPFKICDTFFSGKAPNLVLGFETPYLDKKLYIVSSYIAPPFYESAYNELKQQLDMIGDYTKDLKSPVITVGEYNIYGSHYDLQQLRKKVNLTDSRRGYRPDRDDGYISFLEVPTDHIFYTNQMNCIDFRTISGPNEERLGIMGSYQFSKDSMLVSNN